MENKASRLVLRRDDTGGCIRGIVPWEVDGKTDKGNRKKKVLFVSCYLSWTCVLSNEKNYSKADEGNRKRKVLKLRIISFL